MSHRTVMLGGRDIKRIGLGTNRLTNTPENREFLQQAVAAGLDFIDTAYLYSGGSSEQTIGAAGTGEAVVATKGGYDSGQPSVLQAQIEESLERLQTDAIELYYLHRVDNDTPLEASLKVVEQYRERGAIKNIGISEVTVEQVKRAQGVTKIAAVQNHYNLSERHHDPVIDYCEEQNIVFVPYFPLHGQAEALGAMAAKYQVTESQLALAWLLKRSPVMTPIPGTLSLDHLKENLAALEIDLDDADFRILSD